MGVNNLITDVPGLLVGQAQDGRLASGVTVLLFERPAVVALVVPGGASAHRDTACLEPEATVGAADALVLSGGSGSGLDAAGGVQAWLRERGRGFRVGSAQVPIVPGAVLFDLLNGGSKDWGRHPPYRDLGYAACGRTAARFDLGNAGAGYGATTADLKGGLGSASTRAGGFTVGALAAVNALGSALVGDGPHFWAAPYEQGAEFGGLGLPPRLGPGALTLRVKRGRETGTTLAVVATDAALTLPQAKRLAIMASAGLFRALRLAAAPLDGDTVFAAATGRQPLTDPVADLTALGSAAADCLARAIARGVYEARALPSPGALPAWRDRFGVVERG